MPIMKTVLTFGLISGAVLSAMMLATVPFADRIGFDRAEILGYTTIVLSILFVFFGIRSYREQAGGRISFGRGFMVGLLITVISSACYVVTWEFVYFELRPDFMDKYSAYVIDKARASGASQQAIDTRLREMQTFKKMYDNPAINAAVTFAEPFPIGLVVSAISAAMLKKKSRME